ncbi:MAG: ArnT family glycosyltransferase [Acidimicrobiales bacterium]
MEGSEGQLLADRDVLSPAGTVWADVHPGAGDPNPDAPAATGLLGWPRRGGRSWWSTPAMVLIGVLAGVLYFYQLSHNAFSNTFYAAAVKSGTESWKAFFFGSLDRSSFITVDKPPASLWVMELSGRLFGFSSISMLAPIALAGALTVVVLFHLVRRWTGDVAAVLAATALAVTPVVTAIFRSNEPDAIMTFLLVLAAWALWSALETGATSRLVLCGGLLGLAFLTKMLEAFVVLPAFLLVYFFFGPPKLGRRLAQLVWGGLTLVVASAWWVAIVQLWPVGSRPFIDSSGDNSELSLIFGYNGFGRLLGTSQPYRIATANTRVGHRFSDAITDATHFGSQPGWERMFAPALGSQISWLIPAAGLALLAGLWATRRAPRTDLVRAGCVFWGTWAICAIVVLSSVQGIFHTYYVVEIAPALAALAGGGAVVMWRLGRASLRYAWLLPLAVVTSALWAAHLLERAPHVYPALPQVVEVSGVAGACILLVALLGAHRLPRVVMVTVAALGGACAVVAAFAGPAAYSLYTVQNPSDASNPTGGPGAVSATAILPRPFDTATIAKILARLDRLNEAETEANDGIPPVGGVSPGMIRFLKSHRDGADWILAVGGSTTAAPLILLSGEPVMSMGGFTGSEPVPALGRFERLADAGKIQYVLLGESFGGFSGFGGGFGGFGGFGGTGRSGTTSTPAGTAAVDRWTLEHGVRVPPTAYGSPLGGGLLYYVGPPSAAPEQT